MKQFFTSLKHIELKNFDVDYIEIVPGVNISNSLEIKNKILTERNNLIIGGLESEFIKKSEVFMYYNYEDNDEVFKDVPILEHLEVILFWIDDILKNLWLVKDNNVLSDTSYLIHEGANSNIEAASLRFQYQFTNSKGKTEKTVFSKDEIVEFARYHDNIESHFYSKNSNSSIFMLEKNFSRVNRGLMFVKQARESRNLAFKISNYCTALETLFSTDNAELSHKLSERVAFFLKSDFNTLCTFKTIKKGYGIRSKLTHGDTLDNKQIESLDELSNKIDELLRFSINKIINDKYFLDIFDSSKNVIDQYFEELLFGN